MGAGDAGTTFFPKNAGSAAAGRGKLVCARAIFWKNGGAGLPGAAVVVEWPKYKLFIPAENGENV